MCANPIVIFIHTDVLSGLSLFKLIQREIFPPVSMCQNNEVEHFPIIAEPSAVRIKAPASAVCEPLTAAPRPHVESHVDVDPCGELINSHDMRNCSAPTNIEPSISATRREANTTELPGGPGSPGCIQLDNEQPLTSARLAEPSSGGASSTLTQPPVLFLSRGHCLVKGGSGEGVLGAPHPPSCQEDTRDEESTPGRLSRGGPRRRAAAPVCSSTTPGTTQGTTPQA